jgi:hypothetical protein
MDVVTCRLPGRLARLTETVNARAQRAIHVLWKLSWRSSQSGPREAECTTESDNLRLLNDISWNILSPPETARLCNPALARAVPLPPVLRSRVVLSGPIQLRVYDRGGDKTAQLAIRGTVEDILQTIHAFFKDMNEKYERTHPSCHWPDASYAEEDEAVHGWDTGETPWYEGIELIDGEYTLKKGT